MPGLDTKIHLDMLGDFKRRNPLPLRLLRALKRELFQPNIYGLEWGDPEVFAPLGYMRDHFVKPYVRADRTGLEIGPGGGRWTRYLLDFQTLYIVDFHQELLDQLRRGFHEKHMIFVKNNGSDFPGVPDASVDFLFSFGVFVHLDPPLIQAYLASMKRVLKPGADVVLQYADKTKIMAQGNPGFSDNDPPRMRAMVEAAGYRIVEEDLTSLWHSSVIRFQP